MIQKEKDILSDDDEIKRLTREIRELESSIYFEYISFSLPPKTSLQIPYSLSLKYYTESVLNAFVNRASFENEIKANINIELENIISCFELPPSRLSDIIEFHSDETHNEGRNTCFITLENQKGTTKLVYKPRCAKIDDIVISTFRQINAIESKNDKSADFDLPTYTIFHCRNENASVWEYISAKSLRENYLRAPPSLGNYVSGMSDDLLIKAVRMDEVLSLLHIGDLHGENIMVRERDGRLDFVPIDLEVVCFPKDIEQPTKTELNTQSIKNKLVSERKYKGLTEAEKTIIRQMREGFLPHTSRFVPLGTYLIVKKLVDMSNYRFLSSAFEKTILEDGFIPIEGISSLLKENILLDYLNNDVPYLSIKKGELYYGNPDKKILLAKVGG